MREILAVVNEEGRFIREYSGVTFDLWALPNNERANNLLSKIHELQQEYTAVVELGKADKIQQLETEFRAFVIEARKCREAVVEIKSCQPIHDSEKRRLDANLNRAQLNLKEVAGSGPRAHDFPTEKEIAAHKAKVNKAQQRVNEALQELRQCDMSRAQWERDTNEKVAELNVMIAKHDAMKLKLDRMKGVVTTSQQNAFNSSYGLSE